MQDFIRRACKHAFILRRVGTRFAALWLICLGLLFSAPLAAQQMVTPASFAAQSNGNFGGSIPIHLPPGTAGLSPGLAISYSSHSSNGLLGLGFSLQGLSAITRCSRTQAQDGVRGSVNYDANDRYCLDGQRLVPVTGSYSNYGSDGFEYRTEFDSFGQVISHGTTGNGPTSFSVRTKSGLTETFGGTADSGVVASGLSSIRTWALNKVQDAAGNYYTITYTDDANGAYYPSVINYTGNGSLTPQNSVTFAWQTRTDPIQAWTHGAGVKIVNRLASIQVTAAAQPVRLYSLTYDNGGSGGASRLKSVQECAANGGSNPCMPVVSFNWQGGSAITQTGTLAAQPDGTQIGSGNCAPSGSNMVPPYTPLQFSMLSGNFSGSGRTDFLCDDPTTHWKVVYVSNGDGTFSAPYGPWPSASTAWCGPNHAPNQSNAWSGANLLLSGDFNGDGMQDMACIGMGSQTQTLVYVGLSSGGGAFTQPQSSWSAGGSCPGAATVLTGDFDGDGRTDLICVGSGANASLSVALSNGDGTFASPANVTWPSTGGWCSNPYIQVADFNGDGKSDLICVNTVAGQYTVALSNGDGSFTSGPTFTGSGSSWCAGGSVQIADVNGDGKSDLICTDTSNKQTVAFSKGDGTFYLAATWPTGSAWCPSVTPVNSALLTFADLNGDGKADMICQSYTQGAGGTNITVAYSNGDGTFATPGGTTSWCGVGYLTAGDVNGDGATDLACFGGTITATALAGGTPDLVIGYNNGLTSPSVAAVTASYLPLTNVSVFTKGTGSTYPTQDAIGPYYVVSSVARANGIGNVLTTNYAYTALKSDLSGRGSLGFGTVQSTDVQSSLQSKTIYNQVFPLTGLPYLATTITLLPGQGGPGGLLKSVVDEYQCINPSNGSACTTAVGNRYFPALQYATVTSYDLNGAALPISTTTIVYDTTYTFFGNVKTVSTSNADGYTKTTTNTYNAPDLTHWWLGQVNETQVTSTTP